MHDSSTRLMTAGSPRKWRLKVGILIALILLIALGWLVIVPIVGMAPLTNHYKQVRPFSTAIASELGDARVTELIATERLDYCGYVPVQMCVRLYLKNKTLQQGELEGIRDIAKNVCAKLVNVLPAKRENAISYAACNAQKQSLYVEVAEIPPLKQSDLVVITLLAVPLNQK